MRKRNPDGTPFIKGTKQPNSPGGSEFSKFRIQPEYLSQQLSEMDTASSWSWSPTPSLPTTPEFGLDTTPEPLYMSMDASDLSFMDGTLRLDTTAMQTAEPELIFRDPFAKSQSMLMDLPDLQALKDYIGGDAVHPMEYTFNDITNMDTLQSCSATSSPQSPKSRSMHSNASFSTSMPTTHCCYTLAYSTLESLKAVDTNVTHVYTGIQQNSFDSLLEITKSAVRSVFQLLSCPCSSDPHLAMLYSSITSKILTWYRIAAGIQTSPSFSAMSSSYMSSLSSELSSPSISSNAEGDIKFDVGLQSLRLDMFEFEELGQVEMRRQLVLSELQKCGRLVEALANWRGDGATCEQGEFLYDVLGAWLKSELYKTVNEVKAMDAL
jgi:hypothetical protein